MALLRQIEKPARARLLVVLGLKPEPLELSDFPAVFISQRSMTCVMPKRRSCSTSDHVVILQKRAYTMTGSPPSVAHD